MTATGGQEDEHVGHGVQVREGDGVCPRDLPKIGYSEDSVESDNQ